MVFSWRDIIASWKSEAVFREETLSGIIMLPTAFFLGETLAQTALLIVELFNTGIEHVVSRVGLEHHELSRLAKDAGSTTVFFGAWSP